MSPEDFVKRLEAISSPYGTLTPELRRLADAEANCAAEIGRYKGYGALSNAFKHFVLSTVPRFNVEIRPRVKDALPAQYGMLFEKLVQNYQSLRAAEIAALNGYPLQAYTILRNVFDAAVLASAAMQGFTDFERLEGIRQGEPVDMQRVKRNRKSEEQAVRHRMDGQGSSLGAQTIAHLKALDDLYDTETHGARLSAAQSAGWLKGTEPLPVSPVFSEFKASIFINRFCEVGWMVHRLIPLIQPPGIMFAPEWSSAWRVIDESFEITVTSLTKSLGKPVGAAVCEFVRAKFPFSDTSTFPTA
jgi:hypothetical protein